MSRFAIFYNRSDLAAIAGEVQRNDLTVAQKQTATKFWNAGAKNWNTAPVATGTRPNGSPFQDSADPNDPTLVLVIDSPSVTLADLISLLRSIATSFPSGSQYMNAIADDLSLTAVEPWV